MRHMTPDMWHMEECELALALAHMVWKWRHLEDLDEKDDWLAESINYKSVRPGYTELEKERLL